MIFGILAVLIKSYNQILMPKTYLNYTSYCIQCQQNNGTTNIAMATMIT